LPWSRRWVILLYQKKSCCCDLSFTTESLDPSLLLLQCFQKLCDAKSLIEASSLLSYSANQHDHDPQQVFFFFPDFVVVVASRFNTVIWFSLKRLT
jgi:hypothetical protein